MERVETLISSPEVFGPWLVQEALGPVEGPAETGDPFLRAFTVPVIHTQADRERRSGAGAQEEIG